MSISVTISDTVISYPSPSIREGKLVIHDTLDQRSTASFTVYDEAGTLHFSYGQQVSIDDSLLGLRFTGYVSSVVETNLPPTTAIEHAITCIDQRYLADKRVASGEDDDKNMSNQYAGDDVIYLIDKYLADEGVRASYARSFASSPADFARGTLTNVIATDHVDNGNLELAPAGTAVSIVERTTTTFGLGTLTNMAAGNNALTLLGTPTIKLVSTCNGTAGSTLFQMIWVGSYTIVSGDTLSYSMWVADSSPAIQGFVHLHCSNGDNTGGSTTDFFGLPEEQTDLSGYARNTWYARSVNLNAFIGSTVTNAFACFDGDASGTYTAYFHSVKIINGGITKATLFGSTLNSNVTTQDFGYYATTCSVVTAADPTSGSRISPATDLTPVGIAKSGNIFWQAITPDATTLAVSLSFDQGITWIPQTSSSLIAGLPAGASTRSLGLITKVDMALSGNDPTITPTMSVLQCVVNPSYATTKHDLVSTRKSTADFTAGTPSNMTAQPSSAGLTLTGFVRSWLNGLFPSQTLYGNTTPGQKSYHRAYVLSDAGNSDVRSRFDFAGNTWNILDMSISLDIPSSGNTTNNGLVYGTTNWGNANNSYAYAAWVSATEVQLAKGANNSGAGPYSATGLGTFTFPTAFTANSWHTLRVQWNGTSSTQNGIPAHTHNIYVDGVLYLSVVDATYTAAGYVGCRLYNNLGGGVFTEGHFSNFSIVQSYINTSWTSPNYSLNAVGICGTSQLTWNATIASSSSFLAETTIDGGSTWQTATNGSAIAGLTNGVNLASKNLKVRFTFTENLGQQSVLRGFTAWVLSQYSASGERIAPGLPLDPAGTAGSTLVAWNAIEPDGTSVAIDTSLNVTDWTNVGSGEQGGAEIAGMSAQSDPVEDTFVTNTSNFYFSTSQTGGTEATWTWDTVNTRLLATGGTTAFLLYGNLTADDVDIVVDMETSDAAGLVWRVFDTNNFYDLVVADASSASSNGVYLYRVANDTRETLATGTVAWERTGGIPHRIRVTMIGPRITVSFDGEPVITYTDHFPLIGGSAGLRTNTYGGQSDATFSFLSIRALGQNVQGMTAWTKTRLASTDPLVTPQLLSLAVSVRDPHIQSGAFIPNTAYSVRNGSTNTIGADLDDLARQSNYWCRIDMNKVLFFQPHNGTLAPWCLTGSDLLLDFGVSVEHGGDLYRNTPWILGGTDTILSDREKFTTDGIAQSFTMDYPIDSLVSITAGGQAYTFGIKGIDTNKDFYFQEGNNTINQDTALAPLPPGLTLLPIYYGQVNTVANAQSAAEVAARAILEDTSGLVEVAETAPGLNAAAATNLAVAREVQYTPLSSQLTGTTARAGLAVGQLLNVFLPQHQLVNRQLLITDMSTQWRTDTLHGYSDATPYFTITAVSGPILNSWATTLAGLGR